MQREDLTNQRQLVSSRSLSTNLLFLIREVWRHQSTVENSIQNIKDELIKHERNLRASMGKVRVLYYYDLMV